MRVSYHSDAEFELFEAAEFYEERMTGLGADFIAEIAEAVASIREAPERWQIVDGEVRHYLVHRFPYAVVYVVVEDELQIVAVKHHSRHPDYWKYRLGGTS